MAFSQKELDIIKYGQANGRSRAEVESALASFRSGVVPAPKPQVEQTLTGQTLASKLGGRAKDFGKEALNVGTFGLSSLSSQDAQEARQSPEQAGLVGLQALSNAGMAPFRAAGAAGGAVGDIFGAGLQATGLDKPLSEALAPVAQSGVAQKAVQAFQALPKEYQDYLKTGLDASNLIGLGIGKKAVTTGLESVGKLTPSRVNMADDVLQSGKNLKDSIQLSIAKKNVNPQLESSAERLMKETTQNVEDPIVAYEKYLSQSKESMGDIKVDAPISTVGGKIGDAFMNVVKQRQSVGATLGEELKSVGKLRVSVAEPKSKLLAELSDSGLSYNPKTKQLTSFQGSKFAPEEVSMLNQFVKDVEALGETPTVSQIDNFIAKTRSDLSFAKGKSGVVGTTNAERIIKGNLAGLRESLNPANNGISRLSPYWKANQTYSELSDFLEEGATFLGKKTQSGDFAKDASVAKSSVQSILNGGKKDWLIKLEGLTGYPALDDSVLALQAMKDAGDFKGLSLLQAMQETGGLPTSKAGFIQKVLDMAVERGEKLIVGTPEEQTRALLQSLKKPQTAKPTTPKTTPKASSGDKANKINQSNSGIQPNTTPTPPKGKGIRGMIDFDEIMKSLIPTKKLVAEAKDAVDELESAISFAKVAKSPQAVVDLRKALAELMTSMGKETVITNSNYKKIIQEADDMVSMLKAHIKNSEAQASNDVIERRFIKNPTTGKLEGSSKKKVVSEYKSAEDYMNSQKSKDFFAKLNEQKKSLKPTPTSNNLYHTTSSDNLESIIKNGLTTGNKARFEGVSSPNKISFGANESTASYYSKTGDIMLRTKTGYKPNGLEEDLLAGGKGAYTTPNKIPTEMLQVKIKGKWYDLTDPKVKELTQPKVSSPLEQEAKKYKSAEDFVKAQGTPVYHGTDAKFETFKKPSGEPGSEGIFVAPSASNAEYYKRTSGGEVKELYLKKDAKIWDYKNPQDIKALQEKILEHIPENKNRVEWNKLHAEKDAIVNRGIYKEGSLQIRPEDLVRYKQIREKLDNFPDVGGSDAKTLANKITGAWYTDISEALKNPKVKSWFEQNYDGWKQLDHTDYGTDVSIGIFSPDTIKTKSQLTDIWKKANKK